MCRPCRRLREPRVPEQHLNIHPVEMETAQRQRVVRLQAECATGRVTQVERARLHQAADAVGRRQQCRLHRGSAEGVELGGWAGAEPESTAAWYRRRLERLSLIEVRGRVKLAETQADQQAEHLRSLLPLRQFRAVLPDYPMSLK